MAPLRSIRCTCGFEVRSTNEDELIRIGMDHVKTIHNQVITVEQAKALIQPVV